MGVHAKLQNARVTLQHTPLRKSGANKHHGFTYFELGDFLPAIQKIFAETGLMGRMWFDHSSAYLAIYDTESPEEFVVFSSPVAEAQLRGGTPIQQLGATHTYMRRYLWLMAMEIVENDLVDAQEQEPAKPAKPAKPAEAPKKLAGKPGGWQLSISSEVEGGIDNWIAKLDEALTFMLGMAQSVEDVTEIFRVNRNIFDTLKGEDDAAYSNMLLKFSAAKKQLMGE